MPEEKQRKQWQVPAYGSDSGKIHEWMKQQIDDGREYSESSPGYEQLEEAIRILSGRPSAKLALKQKDERYSRLQTNRLKRNLREMINSLSEIRYNPGYHADSNDVHDQAELLNKVGFWWYVDRFIDIKIKKAVQWMAISPCGWLELCYRQIPGERGKRVIDAIPLSAFDVVMTGVPDSGDHQEAYTVTIIKDVPIYLAHALWPDHQEELIPDRESPRGWMERVKEKATELYNEVFGNMPDKSTAKNPTVRLYYQYVLDLSVNRSGKTIKMGYEKVKDATEQEREVETPWSYEVPSFGQPVHRGYDDSGTPVYKMATVDDARMFPGRRLIVGSEQKKIYDGPMFDWHGKVPLVKLCGDSWPFADFSMVHDVANIQETVNEMERLTHQTARNRYNPSILYNMRAIAREKAKALRTDLSGQRIGYNGNEGQANNIVQPLLPKDFYSIEGWYSDFIKYMNEQEDYQMGVRDISALSKMKAGASADSLEKMLELAGPIVKGISRDMERSMRDLAEMFKFLVMQYMTTPQLMQIVGPDGVTPQNFDYDPGNLIPSHLPGEKKERPSVYSKMHRAKWLADHVSFIIMPGTMHEIVQTAQKLMFLQLWRAGFPIDPWTLAEVLRLGNFGKKPDGANSMMELWMAWQKQMLEFKAALSAEAQELAGEQGAQPNAPNLGPGGGQKGTGGRPASAQASPQMAQKGDGRTLVRESK